MKNPARVRGFTLIEMLVVMVLMLVLVGLGIPALRIVMHQAKLLGFAQGMKTMMRQARLDAIKGPALTVVQIVPAPAPGDSRIVRLFADTDNDQRLSGTETVIASFTVPSGVAFEDKDGKLNKDSVDGFTTDPDGGPSLAIFQRDGSVNPVGAFRLADPNGNFLEVRVTSVTGKIEIRKWNGTAYVHIDDQGKAWTWE